MNAPSVGVKISLTRLRIFISSQPIFRTVPKDHRNASVVLRKSLWRAGKLRTCASRHPSTRHGTRDDTNAITTSQNRAARRRQCNGSACPSRAINSVAECDHLRRRSEALCASQVASRTALAYGATAGRAHPKHTSGVECPMPSATAEAVRTAPALRLHRTLQLRASGARAASSSSCSPPATSASQPMSPETQRVVQHMVDGLWATGSIIRQRLVAKG